MNFIHRSLIFIFALTLIPLAVNATLKDDLTEVSNRVAPTFDEVQWLNRNENFAESLGNKVLLVNFWATWCPPCIEELPSIQESREFFSQDDFEVIAVNAGETVDTIEVFLSTLPVKLTVPIVLDERLAVYADWQVRPLPTTFLVDRYGKIRYQAVGGRNFASSNIRAIIEQLIDE